MQFDDKGITVSCTFVKRTAWVSAVTLIAGLPFIFFAEGWVAAIGMGVTLLGAMGTVLTLAAYLPEDFKWGDAFGFRSA